MFPKAVWETSFPVKRLEKYHGFPSLGQVIKAETLYSYSRRVMLVQKRVFGSLDIWVHSILLLLSLVADAILLFNSS